LRTIYPPTPDLRRNERLSACRAALEPALWQLIDRAELAGWSGTEAVLASVLVLSTRGEAEQDNHEPELLMGAG
jgi:hypothetical protein